jgi:hypothetical protein
LRLVLEMGLIITVWLLLVRLNKIGDRPWRVAWSAAWRTSLLLFIYGAAVLAWMQFSRHTGPMKDSAFLPILGHVNSHFFSEVGWLTYVLNVIPIMGCISGLLYCLQARTPGWAGPAFQSHIFL